MEKQAILSELKKAAERTGLDLEDLLGMIPEMIESETENTKKLLQSFNDQDFANVASIAHSVKGACLSYGFQSIADLAHDIEKNPQGGEDWKVPEKAQEILDQFGRLKVVLG